MHHATLVSPSDIKRAVGVLKSFLATCPAYATGQQIGTCHQHSSTGQRQSPQAGHRPQAAPQATSRPQAAGSWQIGADRHSKPKTQQNQTKINAVLREKNALLMTLYPSIEKSIIQLFHYCTYTVLYGKPAQNDKNVFFLAYREDPPPPKKKRPSFEKPQDP
jgi:hypothetical protein